MTFNNHYIKDQSVVSDYCFDRQRTNYSEDQILLELECSIDS